MFYSETLLSKTGPLARVWLSANLERKLNKSNILQTNLEDSVNAIMDQGQAPMALRLSGQLLLGVARIYSRKARYLMDDCNEALVKIKMAFRPGNNLDLDLAAINPEIAAPNTLMPDTIAGDIPTIPILDESLFSGGKGFDLPNLDDPLNWTSQLISSPSIELDRRAPEAMPDQLYEEDLGIDLGLGDDMDMMSIEKDRRAEPEKSIGPDSLLGDGGKIQEDDLGLDLHMDDDDSLLNMNGNADVMDVDPEDLTLTAERLNQQRGASVSSLSSARSSIAREADNTFLTADAEDQSITETQPQPAMKKRKILPVDEVTEIKQQQIKEQQADRSAIIRAPSMLPKDPVLLALMEMQRKGLFVSSIMGDGRSKGWAPELRGILSIEVIRKNAGTKRKRREVEAEAEREPSLQLEIPAEDSLDFSARRADLTADDSLLPAPGDEEDDAQAVGQMNDPFDETTMPLVHPEDQGPISQGTHHAVHLLRDHFGGDEQSGGSKQQRQHVMFQNMFPESRTSKVDATKMFFEVLVLATKDAIKVEQPEDRLGGPIKIRAKRGLWGAWAEEKAGGEAFGTQAETEAAIVA